MKNSHMNYKKANNSIKNGQKTEQTGHKKIQITHKHMKNCSSPFVIRKIKIKTSMISIWLKFKKLGNIKFSKDVEQLDSQTSGGARNFSITLENNVAVS